jgi:hypothetical protein
VPAVGQDDAGHVFGGRCQGFADQFADGMGTGDGQLSFLAQGILLDGPVDRAGELETGAQCVSGSGQPT